MAEKFYFRLHGQQTVVDENGKDQIRFGIVQWNENKPKFEIRRWTEKEKGRMAGKGVVFLTEQGPNTLTEKLVEQGYGDTHTILDLLKQREDFEKKENGEEKYITKDDLMSLVEDGDDVNVE